MAAAVIGRPSWYPDLTRVTPGAWGGYVDPLHLLKLLVRL
jgi:hypothetical protein